jgi:hypothetical protein
MAEAEYISKEAALACFSDWIDRYGHEHSADEMAEYQRIEDLPVEDVRPVVRCKDCKYYTEGKLLGPSKFCYFYQIGTGLNTADDDFCSKGERRKPNLDTTKGERRDESSG